MPTMATSTTTMMRMTSAMGSIASILRAQAPHPLSVRSGRVTAPRGRRIMHGMTDAVVVRELVVRRGRTEILHGLDAHIAAGQVVGLLGPSGAGKTTLMRTIIGAQRTASGTV